MELEDFKNIIISSDLFRFNSILPKYLTCFYGNKMSIKLIGHTDSKLYVDFYLFETNLFASHKLEDLTLNILITELDKGLSHIPKYKEWSKIELRDIKIENILR